MKYLSGPSAPLEEAPCYILKKPLSEQKVDPLFVRTIQELSGAQFQPNFFSARGPRHTGFAKKFYHIVLAKYETAIKDGGLVPVGLEGNKRRPTVYFTLVNPWTKNEQRVKDVQTLEASPRRDLR